MTQHRESCLGYGFKEGTEAFAGCMQNEEQSQKANRNARAAALLGSGAFKTTAPTVTPYQAPTSNRISCTSQPGLGGSSTLNCY